MELLEPTRIAETAAPYIDGTPEPLKAVYDDTFMLSLFNVDQPLDQESLAALTENIMLITDCLVYINGFNNLVDVTKKAYQIPLFDRFKYTEPYITNSIHQYNELVEQTELAIKGNTKNDALTMNFKLAIYHTIFKHIDMSKDYAMSKNQLYNELKPLSENHVLNFLRDSDSPFIRNFYVRGYTKLYDGAENLSEDITNIWQNYKTHRSQQ